MTIDVRITNMGNRPIQVTRLEYEKGNAKPWEARPVQIEAGESDAFTIHALCDLRVSEQSS